MSTNKKFQVKVYDSSGTYLTNWEDELTNDISFTQQLNTQNGDLQIYLARSATSFGEGSDVNFNNQVKIYVIDTEATTPTLLYQGFIGDYEPVFESVEYVIVTLLPFDFDLDKILHLAGETTDQSNTTDNTFSSITGGEQIAQSFIPTMTPISSIELEFAVSQSTNSVLTIQADSGGRPSGTALSNSTVNKTLTNMTKQVTRFTFGTNVAVTVGAIYWIVLQI